MTIVATIRWQQLDSGHTGGLRQGPWVRGTLLGGEGDGGSCTPPRGAGEARRGERGGGGGGRWGAGAVTDRYFQDQDGCVDDCIAFSPKSVAV